jgi:FkbM family methyltransferase
MVGKSVIHDFKLVAFALYIFLFNSVVCGDQHVLFRQFIKSGDLVFDVGAHVGKKAETFLQCGARVICVEPQPLCLDMLKSAFTGNDNVVIVNKGLAAQHGTMVMYICPTNTISTFSTDWTKFGRFAEQGYVWNKTIEVEMTTLDELIEIYGIPKFCKIDVENFEYEVLCGLTQAIPCLSFEFHEEYLNNTKRCLNRLVELGFSRFNFAIGENSELALNEWVSSQDILRLLKSGDFKAEGGLLLGDIYASI